MDLRRVVDDVQSTRLRTIILVGTASGWWNSRRSTVGAPKVAL